MFKAPKLTNGGKALYYENLGGTPIKFTTIQMGSGVLTGSIPNMTALVTPVVTINAAVAINGEYVDISGKFSNAELAEGFYWREIGVFAADPTHPTDRTKDILYCYQNAYDTADFIPVASVETVEKNITVPVIVGDATTVSCTLSKSLILATLKDLEDHNADAAAHAALIEAINESLERKQNTIAATGILKGSVDAAGKPQVGAAIPGTDYQPPTQELQASTDMILTDTIPYFSGNAGKNKSVTLKNLKEALGVQSASINVTTCAGAAVTCTDGITTLNGVGSTKFSLPKNEGIWTVTATLAGSTATVEVEVTGALQYNADLMITTGISITTPPAKVTYDVGEAFSAAGMVVKATFADNTTQAVTADCTYSPATMAATTTAVTVTYQRAGITKTTTQAVTVRKLSSIAVTNPPVKTAYYIGETFNSAGVEITATMSDGSTKAVTGYSYTPTGALAAGATTITFSYTENNVTKTATQAITVRVLSSIQVTTTPTKTAYKYGETFNSAGMAITATYNDGATRAVSGWTYTPTSALTLASTTVTVSYSEGGVTKTTTQAITVSNTLSSIAITTPPTKTKYFTGNTFSPAGMVVKATYGDGSTAAVTGYSYAPTGSLGASDNTITVSYTYNGVTKTATQAITVTTISTTLNANTWATIREVSDAGVGANYWSTGDAKTMTVNGAVGNTNFSNLSISPFIVGFNHNASREGNNRIHFQLGKIGTTMVGLCDSNYGSSGSSAAYFQMNASNTNSGGWNGSSMRNSLLGNSGTPASPPSGSLLAAFPADLRAVMKPCTKYSDNTGGGSDTAGYVTSTTDYLPLPSEFEIHGARTYANSAEQNYQAQYDYYKAGNSKIKYKHNETGTAAYAWCRSVRASNTSYFCRVNTDGNADSSNACDSCALAPCFFV